MTDLVIQPDDPRTLPELLERAVRLHRHRPLFGTKVPGQGRYDWVTYGAFADQVDRVRAGLALRGIGPGDAVGIIANNRTEWAVAAYATYGRAARFVPMYEAELPRIWRYIVSDARVKVLLVSRAHLAAQVRELCHDVPTLEAVISLEGDGPGTYADLARQGAGQPVAATHPDPETVAGLIYTSGTTGNPKGVLLGHGNLVSNVLGIYQLKPANLGAGDRTLSFLPWAHAFGQMAELHLLLHAGASTGFAEQVTTVIDDIQLVRPTLLVAVPRVYQKIADGLLARLADQPRPVRALFAAGRAAARRQQLGERLGLLDAALLRLADALVFSKIRARFGGRLKAGISSSAALSPRTAELLYDVGIPVYEAWGMTELSPAHTLNLGGRAKLGSVGRVLPGCALRVERPAADEGARDGELVAYGPNVMQGYHGLPEATAAVLRPDGGLATGDRGWVDAEGYVFITGRIKEQYKLENGKYVFPAALEEAIKLSPYIEHAMVEGANRPYNVAVIVPDLPALGRFAAERGLGADPEAWARHPDVVALLLAEIRRLLADVASYEVPRRVLIASEPFTTENGILTPTLKIKRREVLARYGEALAKLYADADDPTAAG
jgi:long-chain acyl-CoA synthetase